MRRHAYIPDIFLPEYTEEIYLLFSLSALAALPYVRDAMAVALLRAGRSVDTRAVIFLDSLAALYSHR